MLVVEDNDDVADAMRILLEHNGYRVTTSTNVAEALQVGVHDTPQFVLLDLSLGDGEDGLELLARWRECNVFPARVIALTGHADERTRDRCTAAGCATVLIKPAPSADVLASLKTAG